MLSIFGYKVCPMRMAVSLGQISKSIISEGEDLGVLPPEQFAGFTLVPSGSLSWFPSPVKINRFCVAGVARGQTVSPNTGGMQV